jgi:hypothetical protein
MATPVRIWARTILTDVGIALLGQAQLIAANWAAG